MKTLNLTVKKKWFDMIASGVKKEEYREIKPYWVKRLTQSENTYPDESERLKKGGDDPCNRAFSSLENNWRFGYCFPKHFDQITFRNGYSPTSPSITVKCVGIEIGKALPEWSDNWQGNVFVIKLGEIIERSAQ